MIAIVDYNVGNVKSVLMGLNRIGLSAQITGNADIIRNADGVILPGVGSFPSAIDNLKERDLIKVLNEVKESGKPILGICLGMQILFEKGYEIEERKGLGFLQGNVGLIPTKEKLPHMGWNELYFNRENKIIKNINENDDVYFVHSYMADFIDEQVIAYTEYDNIKIPAIVGKDNIIGCQFHPEKSGKIGEKILSAWREMIEC